MVRIWVSGRIGQIFKPGSSPQKQQNANSLPVARESYSNYPVMPLASEELNKAIAMILKSQIAHIGNTAIDLKMVNSMYAAKSATTKAFWTNDEGMTEMGLALEELLNGVAPAHGFEAKYYLTDDLVARMSPQSLQEKAELDVLMTQGYMLFVNNMVTGRIDAKVQGIKGIEMAKLKPVPASQIAATTVSQAALFQGVQDFIPKADGYTYLFETLARLNDGKRAGGWTAFTADRATLRYGESHPNVIAVRQRMVDLGFLPYEERAITSTKYDAKLFEAVSLFQEYKFGKKNADGVVGQPSYRALDLDLEKSIRQTRANFERWRLLPRSFPQRYFFVDMGRQQLDIIENNSLVRRMNVVVGKDLNGTPTMTNTLYSYVRKPYWYPPASIIVNEMIPKLKDPDYLTRSRLRILDGTGRDVPVSSVNWSQFTVQNPPKYLFRQDSGPENSLGLAKFNLDNDHAIYMHDTNNREVFKDQVRYMSHGCIRLEQPFVVAAYLLGDQAKELLHVDKLYDLDSTAQLLEVDAENALTNATDIKVKPITVYIFGSTMVNYSKGEVVFGPDIYGQDDQINKALDQMAEVGTAVSSMQQQK